MPKGISAVPSRWTGTFPATGPRAVLSGPSLSWAGHIPVPEPSGVTASPVHDLLSKLTLNFNNSNLKSTVRKKNVTPQPKGPKCNCQGAGQTSRAQILTGQKHINQNYNPVKHTWKQILH